MPTPSPICQIKEGAGAWQSTTNGVDVTPAATITIGLVSTAGVEQWSITCIGTDESQVAATITSSLSINAVAKTATFTAPAAGSALIFQSVVNGGVDINGRDVGSYTTTFGIYTLTSVSGLRVVASNETTEGSAAYGWVAQANTVTREVDAALGLISGTSENVVLVGTGSGGAGFLVGDWICSADDAANSLKSKLANTANLAAVGGVVRGVMLETGVAGETKQAAGTGDTIAASICGLGAGADGPVILNPASGRAERKANPAPTDIVLGACDAQGNVDIQIVHPGVGTWVDNLSHVSVLDYGADPTGVSDSSAAHDAAHAVALATGKKLLYGAGTYKLGASKTITAALEIVGMIDGRSDLPLSKIFQVDATPYSSIAYTDETTDASSATNADFAPFPSSEAVGDYCLFGYSTPFGRLVFDYANGTAGVGGAVLWQYYDGVRWQTLEQVTDGTSGFTAAVGDGKSVTWAIPSVWPTASFNGSASLYWVRALVLTVYSTNPVLDQVFVGNAATLTISGPLECRRKKIFGDALNVAFGNTATLPTEIDPVWWGAVGDGSADDTRPIQRAHDALRGGDTLKFFKSSNGYKVTSTIRMWGGTKYRGADAINNTIVFENSGATFGSISDCARLVGAFSDFTGSAEIDAVGSGSGSGTFTANASTDVISFAAGTAGDLAQVQLTTTGTLPAGLSLATNYWLIELAEGECKVATTLANAIAGTAINITDAGTGTHTLTVQSVGGTARQMMRLKNPTGITAQSDVVGLPIRTWNCTDVDNVQQSTVCKIKRIGADLFMWVWNPTATATAPDNGHGGSAGAGTVRFRIERSILDYRAREVKVRNHLITMLSGFRVGGGIAFTESPAPAAAGSTATTTTETHVDEGTFSLVLQTAGIRGCVRVADDIIPTIDSSLSRFIVNGDGVPIPWAPFQCDYVRLNRIKYLGGFYGSKSNAILGFGRAAQSERNLATKCEFSGMWNGFFVPRSTVGGSNQCHFDFYDCELGHFWDSFVDFSSTAFDVHISRCKGEFGSGRLLNDRGGSSGRLVRIEGCEWQTFATGTAFRDTGHPTRRFVETNSAGTILFFGNSLTLGGDNSKYRIIHLNHNQGASGQYANVVAFANRIQSSIDIQGTPGFVDARAFGPYRFSGTETLDVKIDGGATTTVTFSQANFNTALAVYSGSYTIDMNEVRAAEVAALIAYTVGRDKLQAYGSEDDRLLRLFSNDTAGSSVQVTGGTANTQLDFNVASTGSRGASFQITTDTKGVVEASAPSSSDETTLAWFGNSLVTHGSISWTPNDVIFKTYLGSASAAVMPGVRLESIRGLSRPGSAVPPQNFWQQVTKTGATNSATFTADAGTDECTMSSGAPFDRVTKVQLTTTGTLPAGLSLATDYWLIKVSATVYKLATSAANAIAGTAVNITDVGTGTHTATVVAGFSTVAWDFDTAEANASYSVFAQPIAETGTPAAGSRTVTAIHKATTFVAFQTTDPGAGNTVLWHAELRR